MSSRWTSRLTTVRFEDAGGLGLEWGPGPGDLSIGNENAENAEHIKKLDRGKHDGFVLGDDLVQDLSITAELPNESLTHATLARLHDFIKRQGSFAAAVSVDPCIWAFKVIVTFDDGVTTTTKTCPIVEGEHAFAEAKEGSTLAVSARNHGPIVES
jgi:hypothetical protein